MNAQEHFDEDYRYVRKALVRGVLSLQAVKDWVQYSGSRTETKMMKEEEAAMSKKWGKNVDRASIVETALFLGKEGDNDE